MERVAWLLALTAAWCSSGFGPVADAVTGARAPSDFATDFVPASRIGQRPLVPGVSPTHVDVAAGNAVTARFGAPPYPDVGVPFGAHPPTALLLVAALVPLGFAAAAGVWLLLSLLAIAVVAWVIAETIPAIGRTSSSPNPTPTLAIFIFVLLTLWPPVLHNIEKGQWSALIGGLLAGAWWARTRGHDRAAGALIALAGLFKIMPLLALLAFLGRPGRRRRDVLAGAVATVVIAGVASAAIVGPGAWQDFLRAAPLNTRGWQTGPGNTLSLWGALARLLIGGPFAQPLAAARRHPGVALWGARLLWSTAALATATLAARLTLRGDGTLPTTWQIHEVAPETHAGSLRHDAIAYAAWCTLAVILGPLSWSHTAIFLLLPLSLLTSVLSGRRRAPRLLLAMAAVVLAVPRVTLFAIAGAVPVTPGGGLLLSLHLAAALTIFLAAVRTSPPPR